MTDKLTYAAQKKELESRIIQVAGLLNKRKREAVEGIPCRFFLRGNCLNLSCPYSHQTGSTRGRHSGLARGRRPSFVAVHLSTIALM
jgi:hypothetical protein